MAFGDKTKKVETELEAKAHISFILEGDDVDKVDWLQVIKEQGDYKIVHGDVKIYYTEKKE